MASVKTSADLGANVAITVTGLQELRKDLMAVEPKLNYKLNARLKRVGNKVAGEARQMTGRLSEIQGDQTYTGRPSHLATQAGDAMAGIGVKSGGGKGSVIKIIQDSRIGAIVEFAEVGHSPQGRAFVSMLDRHFGQTGRFVWKAADANREYVSSEILAVVRQTEAELNAKIGIA